MEIKVATIGQFEGQPVLEATLVSETGVSLSIISFGAIVRDWQVPFQGTPRSVVLGFKTFEEYLADTSHIGAIVGRVANRISSSQFSIGAKTFKLPANAGEDHLHGGPQGLSRRNWSLKTNPAQNSVILKYLSPAGEMGYPGSADFTVTYTLEKFFVRIDMEATVTALTPISMVQHQYFNLDGAGKILDHTVTVNSDHYTPLNSSLIPTGDILSVEGTPFDFRKGRSFRNSDGSPLPYDVNLALSTQDRSKPVATVAPADNALTLKLWTDRPGLQLYTGEHLSGYNYPFEGLCLEDQGFPDAVNKPQFPHVLVAPFSPYVHFCGIEIRET